MSDYRDDRGALRERNAELEEQLGAATQALAEREREVAELRARVPTDVQQVAKIPEEPVLGSKREVQIPAGPRVPISKRAVAIGAGAIITAFFISGIGMSKPMALLGAIVTGALTLVVLGWPRKE